MVDTFRPLGLGPGARDAEDDDYAWAWPEGDDPSRRRSPSALESLVDYAGLFRRHHCPWPTPSPSTGPVGRATTVGCSAGSSARSRLEELAGLLTASMAAGEAPWRLSVVFDGPPGGDAIAAAAFDRTMSPGAFVELVEVRLPVEASDGRTVDAAEEVVEPVLDTAFTVAADVVPFVEVARGPGVGTAVDAVARVRHRRLRPAGAKLRTGRAPSRRLPRPGRGRLVHRRLPPRRVAVQGDRRAAPPGAAPRPRSRGDATRVPQPAGRRRPRRRERRSRGRDRRRRRHRSRGVRRRHHRAGLAGPKGGRRLPPGDEAPRCLPAYGSCSFDEPVDDLVAMGILE